MNAEPSDQSTREPAGGDESRTTVSLTDPVRHLPHEADEQPTSGYALCLSGGGYRAMLFHVGVLWRLNELGQLPKLDRISSVSGGSITAGVLGLNWHRLSFTGDVATNFSSCLVDPVRSMADHGVDVGAVFGGGLNPFRTISEKVTSAYRKHLFGQATLQDLPPTPRFVINATNVESGALMRFSRPYIADWRVGQVRDPTLALAVAPWPHPPRFRHSCRPAMST